MGKSLEFVKERIASGQCNGMENNKYESMIEQDIRGLFTVISYTKNGTILDRVPRYDRFEQIFSAGFDDIIKDGYRFKYSINEIPKSLIKLCRKYPIKLSNNTVKYYKENQDAHYIAYNLDYLSLSPNDIYTV